MSRTPSCLARVCQQGEPGRRTSQSIAPVIPYKTNEKDKPAFFAKLLYKARAPIQQGIGVVKRFKRRQAVRENGQQLSIHRQLRSRTMLDQIRPHGLILPVHRDSIGPLHFRQQ